MRLLNVKGLEMREFTGQPPPYAILSHTWGNEEVSFQDFECGQATWKSGYEKILCCCNRAEIDELNWVWIDTCCIDKTSSAELSEAINSMFRWYLEAEVCYAFLEDVCHDTKTPVEFETEFVHSRWFTRGWTLQELLAPPKLVFFDSNWRQCGTRARWEDLISKTTGIHSGALCGDLQLIQTFSVAQRMSWAATRQTSREEDVAYCLMGLFDVNMPLIYGEGPKAFVRLQEEILKQSNDESILAWGDQEGSSGERGTLNAFLTAKLEKEVKPARHLLRSPILATSPRAFRHSSGIVAFETVQTDEPYRMTNTGLRIEGRFQEIWDQSGTSGQLLLVLKCYDELDGNKLIGLRLIPFGQESNQYHRTRSWEPITGPGEESEEQARNIGRRRTIFIRKDEQGPTSMPHKASMMLERFEILSMPSH